MEIATTERTVCDSNARSLSGVPVLQADAAIDVLEEAGQLKLAHPEELVRPPRAQIPTRVGASLLGVPVAAEHEVPYWGAGDGIWFVSGEGVQLRRASSFPSAIVGPLSGWGWTPALLRSEHGREIGLRSDGDGGSNDDNSGSEGL